MKIAMFCPNWVGDVVMATPALRAIRSHFSEAEIVGVMRPYVADVLQGLDLLDRVALHDPRGSDSERRGWPFARRLRDEKFDLAVLFPNSFRSGWLAWQSGAKRRVGFSRNARRWLLTDALIPKSRRAPHPIIDEYLRLASHLGCETKSRRMELATTPEDERSFNEFLKRQSPVGGMTGLVCMNPGGAFGAAKHWPAESFAQLAVRITTELHKRVVVLCGPAERDEAREIARQADGPGVVSFADEPLSLGLTKAAVRRADLLVTTDSGPRHFAPPFGVPVVTVFGPTHIAWSETRYERAVHLQLDVDCGPCQKRVCPLGHHRCMTELSPDRVYRAVASLLMAFPRERPRFGRRGLTPHFFGDSFAA